MTGADLMAVMAVLGAAVILLLLLGLCKRFAMSSELLRKLAHLGTGLLAMSFPWIFSSLQPVLLVCGFALMLLGAVSFIPAVRSRLGASLYSVGRSSHGEFYFPIAVPILFWLARGDKLLYFIPLLVLTLADAVAAILGSIYVKLPYEGIGGSKSVEGSVAFFTVAFFAVHVPLLLSSQLSRPQSLLAALDIALVVTLLEAVSWRGLDNLVIPLGVLLLLHVYSALSVRFLVYRLIAALILLAFVVLYRSRTTLQHTALIAAALVLYASWGAGGWQWFIAPTVLFACYSMFLPDRQLSASRKDNVYAVASVASAGLLWICVARFTNDPTLIFPYTAAYTAHFSLLGWTLCVLRNPAQSAWRRGPILLIECWALMFVPYLFIAGPSRQHVVHALLALPVCGLAFALFCIVEPRHGGLYSDGGWRWLREAALVLLVTSPLALMGGAP
jgi:phytol kinase